MKRIWLSCLCVCLLMCFNITAYAADSTSSDTKIDTVVPSNHTITVNIIGKGGVLKDGADTGDSITVARHGDVTLTLTPDKGHILEKVFYNGEDVTKDVLSNSITLKSISVDGTLDVVYISDPKSDDPGTGDSPKTGDNSNPWLWGMVAMIALGCLVITVRTRNRKHGRAS